MTGKQNAVTVKTAKQIPEEADFRKYPMESQTEKLRNQYDQTIAGCHGLRSAAALTGKLHMKSRESFCTNALQPAISLGLILEDNSGEAQQQNPEICGAVKRCSVPI